MTNTLIERVRDAVEMDAFWRTYLDDCAVRQPTSVAVHLAVFAEPFLQHILDGQKTIESRFSVKRCAPYRRVKGGDILLLKQVGGPVVGVCQVSDVWFYDVDPETLSQLRSKFAAAMCAQEPGFWEERSGTAFATLMRLQNVCPIRPIRVEKRDRRGWAIVRRRSRQLLLWE